MGLCVDGEPDGQPTPPADGDDLGAPNPPFAVVGQCQTPNDDEDGVAFVTPLIIGQTATVNIDLTASPNQCVMDAWIDWGIDGTFDEPGDRIITGLPLPPGMVHPVNFGVPLSAVVGGSYARFRCSINGVPSPRGNAPDGEVEDYTVRIEPSGDEFLDWGDADDAPGASPSYYTLAANSGASHLIGVPGGPFMGQCVDAEPDGQPTPPADGDDLGPPNPPFAVMGQCQTPNDDEDGVAFATPLIIGQQATVNIDLTASPNQCVMDAWIDWGIDGTFDEPGDRIITGLPLLPGVIHPVNFGVPLSAVVGGSYARFRCSINGVPSPRGNAPDGEVEDYTVRIEPNPDEFLDWGDAPDSPTAPGYPTLAGNSGASHLIGVPGGPFMGQCVDAEPDGQPTPPADGDDLGPPNPPFAVVGQCQTPNDDEDGVAFTTPLTIGQQATVNIDLTASPNQCVMDAWIDWGIDGTFDEPGDRIITGLPLLPGLIHPVNFGVPLSAVVGGSYARFRCSINGVPSPRGNAPDGEVEDYTVVIEPGMGQFFDLGDAPDGLAAPLYPTYLGNNGAVHAIGAPTSPFMGLCVDGEPDGQPTIPADGDDLGPPVPPGAVVGTCANNDDEDGVTLPPFFLTGAPASISIDMTASPTSCLGNAWIDFGADNVFDEPGDRIMTDVPLVNGVVNTVNIVVPASPVAPPLTYARFRCSTAGGDLPGGPALDGEVEDYTVVIEPGMEEPIDWGDAPDRPGTVGYRTLSVNNGASHLLGGPTLGVLADPEPDGQPTPNADGDDLNPPGPSDEDGLLSPPLFDLSQPTQCVMLGSASGGQVDAWVDWDRSGTFDPDEYWSGIGGPSFALPGSNVPTMMCFVLPGDELSGTTFARFRISANGIVPPVPYGFWPDGEVEDYAFTVIRDVSLNLNVFLEGPYAGGGLMNTTLNALLPLSQPYNVAPWNYAGSESVGAMPPNVVDWMLMDVRTGPNPGSFLYTEAVLLLDTGAIVNTALAPPVVVGNANDFLYIVLRHRNHLDVMSATGVYVATGVGTHDFTVAGAAWATVAVPPMKGLGPGLTAPFGMYAADGNADGNVQALDFNLYLAETIAGVTGYSPGNYNMDAFTQALDFNLYIANTLAGAVSQVP
jgi:hypothetical protein